MKIVNIVLGLGTAIIMGSLIALGISAFYPAPVLPTYPEPTGATVMPCPSNDAACLQSNQQAEDQQQAAQDQQEAAYESQTSVYGRNLFIVANVVGILVFLLAFWLLFATSITVQSVPIGIMIAGLWSIMYGYMRGWGSVDDRLKFAIGLVIALLVIGGSMWLVERYTKKKLASRT